MKIKAAVFIFMLLAAAGKLPAQTETTGIKKDNSPPTESRDTGEAKNITEKNAEPEGNDSVASDSKRNMFTLWGEGRLRYETQDNFNSQYYGNKNSALNMRDPANTFLLGRVIAGFTFAPFYFAALSLGVQYANVWGSAISGDDYFDQEFGRVNDADRENPEPYNCFLQLTDPFVKMVLVKAGRQLISYGDRRVFSTGSWSNTTRWLWDAAAVSFKHNEHFIDAFYGTTVVHDPDKLSIKEDNSGFKTIGLYSHFQTAALFKEIGLEPFAFTKDNKKYVSTYNGTEYSSYASEKTPKIIYSDLESYYFGARIYGKDLCGFDADFTYVKENGNYSTDKIDACAYHGLLGYSFKSVSINPALSIEYSYASGDSNSTDGIRGTYDGAYADPALFGRMGLFAWSNIKDLQVNLNLQPVDVLSFTMSYHRLKLAEAEDHWYLADARTTWYQTNNSRSIYGRYGYDLGHMIEITVKIQVIKSSAVEFGLARLISGEFIKNLPNTNDNKHYAQLFYFQWESKFDFAML